MKLTGALAQVGPKIQCQLSPLQQNGGLSDDYDLLMLIQVVTGLLAVCTINQVAHLVVQGTENTSSATFFNLMFFMFSPLYHVGYLISLLYIHFFTHIRKINHYVSVTIIFSLSNWQCLLTQP